MDKKLLDIICCPVTHLPLELLDAGRLARLNAAIAGGGVQNRGEQPVGAALDEALVTRDGRLAYPVRDGIPLLLEPEGIDLARLTDDACA
jgi:uncharacterized protein YbaR (Trm112 family)